MRKLLYTPFSLLFGVGGSLVGRRAFRALWASISSDPVPPSPQAPDASLVRIAATAALEGATLAAIAAISSQLAARVFHHLFGIWPVKPAQPCGNRPAA